MKPYPLGGNVWRIFYLSSRKQGKRIPWVVKFRYVPTPNAKERLSRALTILLKVSREERRTPQSHA